MAHLSQQATDMLERAWMRLEQKRYIDSDMVDASILAVIMLTTNPKDIAILGRYRSYVYYVLNKLDIDL